MTADGAHRAPLQSPFKVSNKLLFVPAVSVI